MNLEARAIILHGEVYGWIYKGAETVLEDKNVSMRVLFQWAQRLSYLCEKSRDLHKAVQTEQSKRAWKRALELKVKIKERLKRDYDYF